MRGDAACCPNPLAGARLGRRRGLLLLLLAGMAWYAARSTPMVFMDEVGTETAETIVWHGTIYFYTPDNGQPSAWQSGLICVAPDSILPARVPPSALSFGFASVHVAVAGPGAPWTGRITVVPLWFVALVLIVPLVLWLAWRLLLRRHRKTAGGSNAGEGIWHRVAISVAATLLALFTFFGVAWLRAACWHEYHFGAGRLYEIDSTALRGAIDISVDHPLGDVDKPWSPLPMSWTWRWYPPEKRFNLQPAPDPLPGLHTEQITTLDYSGGSRFVLDRNGSIRPGPPPVPKVTGRRWVVPYWFLLLVTAVLPAWSVVAAVRRRRRIKAGFCQGCGYDLRASEDRCPECGKAVNSSDRPLSVPGLEPWSGRATFVPLWFVALALATAPACWTVRLVLHRPARRSSGGTVTAGRFQRRATTAVVGVSLALFVFFGIAWVRVSDWHDYQFEAGAGKTVFQIDSADLKGQPQLLD
jgi:hypothetical protein